MISSMVGRSSRTILQKTFTQRTCASVQRKQAVIALSTRNAASLAPIAGAQNHEGNDFSSKWMKTIAAMTAAGTLAASGIANKDRKTHCCGIVGVVGTKEHDAR